MTGDFATPKGEILLAKGYNQQIKTYLSEPVTEIRPQLFYSG